MQIKTYYKTITVETRCQEKTNGREEIPQEQNHPYLVIDYVTEVSILIRRVREY